MYYAGNVLSNIVSAKQNGNKDIQRDLIFSQIAELIDDHPDKVLEALNASGANLAPNTSRRKIVHYVVDNLYRNHQFRQELAVLISEFATSKEDVKKIQEAIDAEYSGIVFDWVGDIANMVEGIASPIIEGEYTDERIKEERARAENEITQKMLLNQQRTQTTMPILIVGGVLVIAGMVMYFALRKTRKA